MARDAMRFVVREAETPATFSTRVVPAEREETL